MYNECVWAIKAWKDGSLKEIDIELVRGYVIPHLDPLVLKYDVHRNMEIFKEMFGTCRRDYLIARGSPFDDIASLEPVWLGLKKLCGFLNKILEGEPFVIEKRGYRTDLYFKKKERGFFDKEENVIPFLNFLQKVVPFHWACYPHGLNILCCQNWEQVLETVKNHLEGQDDSGIQEYIFSDEAWNLLKKERPDYTSVKRKSVYDE